MSGIEDKIKEFTEEQIATLYKNVFDTEQGRLVLEDLKNRCFVKTSTAYDLPGDIGVSVNPYQTYFREGMRSVVLHIESQLKFVPERPEW